jgi:hypothetical protein
MFMRSINWKDLMVRFKSKIRVIALLLLQAYNFRTGWSKEQKFAIKNIYLAIVFIHQENFVL